MSGTTTVRESALDLVDLLLRVTLWLSGAAFVLILLILIRNEVTLDLHHSPTTAAIREVNNGGRGPGSLRVTFAVGGVPIDTSVEQPWFGPAFRVGESVAVEFDPGDPTRARLAGLHDLISGLAFLGVVAVFYFGVSRYRHRRGDRTRSSEW